MWRRSHPPPPSDPPSDPPSGVVQDHRARPPGAMPARLQTWVMFGIAGTITLVVLYTHGTAPSTSRAPANSPARATSPNVAAEFRSRLEAQERQLANARRQLAEQQALLDEPFDEPSASADVGQADPEAALRQDQRRREYESLYADHVAYSVRPRAQPSAGGTIGAAGSAAAVDPMLLAALAVAAQTQGQSAATTPPGPIGVGGRERQPAEGTAPQSGVEQGSPRQLTPPLRASGGWHRVLEGTILEAVLTTRLDGDFSGPVQALMTTPLYSHDAQNLLIPAGSRLIGETRAVTSADQQRLAVSFHRLLFPDGRTLALDRPAGLNAIGETGLKDRVSHHYWSIFGAAVAIGAISGLANANFGLGGDDVVVIRGSSTDQAATRILDRYLNRRPTITIREGHRLRVLLTEDVDLPVYTPGTIPQREGSSGSPDSRW